MQRKLDQSEDLTAKLLETKENQKKQESVMQGSIKQLEQQHSDLMVISCICSLSHCLVIVSRSSASATILMFAIM